MGALCGCYSNNLDDDYQHNTLHQAMKDQTQHGSETAGGTRNIRQQSSSSMSASATVDENCEEWKEYCHMMQLSFYCFAGHQPWSKIKGLYLQKADLQVFLDIVNIQDDVETMLKLIDTDIEDGRITINEWMDYFTSKEVNPGVFALREQIESQVTWSLLKRALTVFEISDHDRTGKLEYCDFTTFGTNIGLNDREIECLFRTLDTNNSGCINIVELFEWFRLRLHQQNGRDRSRPMGGLTLCDDDLDDLREFRYGAKSMTVDSEKSKDSGCIAVEQ